MSDSLPYEKLDLFYLGREIDQKTNETSRFPFLYKNKNFTTHAAILGMTGSGKTGLGVCLLEEAAMDKIPAIVIDPKGDMANLLLSFPELQPEDFLPWIDEAKAEQKGMKKDEFAHETAEMWEKGLDSWDQDKARIRRLRSGVEFRVYTPGAESGRPVSVLDSLDAPASDVMADNDAAGSLVNSTVSSILGLIGIKADPLKSREHILLSSVILHQWGKGKDLSLEMLIGFVVNPPFENIGVFPLNNFFPQSKRMEFALQLNNILASPAFSGWTKGEPLKIDDMLYNAETKPRISIFSIAHLSDPERMFFVTMLLSRLVNWMRRQEGSSGLRCLLYMDEIFGYFPPIGDPPSKRPMLMLLKQARAFGIGVVLATQNPVDLDYKGLSNIGTWFIGRLQTRQDQDRVMQGIVDGSDAKTKESMRSMLANMRGRTFLMHSAHAAEPVLFETRWVMSYLKGPISLTEIPKLTDGGSKEHKVAEVVQIEKVVTSSTAGMGNSRPLLSGAIEQNFVLLPVVSEELVLAPWLAGMAKVRFFNQSRGIDQLEEVSLRLPLDERFTDAEWDRAVPNPLKEEDMISKAPSAALYRQLPQAVVQLKNFRSLEKEFSNYLYHSMEFPLWRVSSLKIESKPEESEGDFRQRVIDLLREKKDSATGKVEERYQSKQKSLERRLAKAYDKVEKEESDVQARGMDTALSFGVAIFGALFGRKALSVTTASRSARGMRSAGRMLKEKEDVKRAKEEVKRLEQDVADLARELQDEIGKIAEQYTPDNYPIETFFITPRRSDIFDVLVSLQWEPELDLPPLQ